MQSVAKVGIASSPLSLALPALLMNAAAANAYPTSSQHIYVCMYENAGGLRAFCSSREPWLLHHAFTVHKGSDSSSQGSNLTFTWDVKVKVGRVVTLYVHPYFSTTFKFFSTLS